MEKPLQPKLDESALYRDKLIRTASTPSTFYSSQFEDSSKSYWRSEGESASTAMSPWNVDSPRDHCLEGLNLRSRELSFPLCCNHLDAVSCSTEAFTPQGIDDAGDSNRSGANFSYFSTSCPVESLKSAPWHQLQIDLPEGQSTPRADPNIVCIRLETDSASIVSSPSAARREILPGHSPLLDVSSAMSSKSSPDSSFNIFNDGQLMEPCVTTYYFTDSKSSDHIDTTHYATLLASSLLDSCRKVTANENAAMCYAAEITRGALLHLAYPLRIHPSLILRQRLQTGELQPTQSIGGPNFSAPSVLAHPAEFKNPSSFLKIYGDPMCANGMGAKTPLRGAHGNWTCPKCDCVNFPRRFRCNKCEMYRDSKGDEVVSAYAKHVYDNHLRTYQSIGAKAKPFAEVPPPCSASVNSRRGAGYRKRRDFLKERSNTTDCNR